MPKDELAALADSAAEESTTTETKAASEKASKSTARTEARVAVEKAAKTEPGPESQLVPVEELAAGARLKPWELAGLMRAAGWAPGKQVTVKVFEQAVAAFRNRPQGGGKITL